MVNLSYAARSALRRDMDVYTAAVADVLAHYDSGDGTGVEITAEELACQAGVSEKTARRAITRLQEAGLVSSASQFKNNRQLPNRYHVNYDRMDGGQPDHRGGHGDQANTSTTRQVEVAVVTSSSLVTNSNELLVMPREQSGDETQAGLRPAVADATPEVDDPQTECQDPPWIPWVPRNSPMPMPIKRYGGRKYLDYLALAMWLVSYFEGLVLDRSNREQVAKGRMAHDSIPDKRKVKWIDNAYKLVVAHPLGEVVAVIDWLFTAWSGQLPYAVLAERLNVVRRGDLKLTRIVQIQEAYEGLLAEMNRGVEANPEVDLAFVDRVKINYGHPFPDRRQETKVTELVQLFTGFHLASGRPHKGVHQTRTWRWAKSFRIMLAYRKYEFDDIHTVVTALKDYPDMDRTRYNDPYDLYQHGEWEHLLPAAKLARLKAERRTLRQASDRLVGPDHVDPVR